MQIRQFIVSVLALIALCGSLAHADEPAPYSDEETAREEAINHRINSTCKGFASAILKGEKPEKAGRFCQETHLQLDKFRSEMGMAPAAPVTLEEMASLEQSEEQITETCVVFMQDVLGLMRTEETRSKLQVLIKQLEAADRSSL